MKQRKSLLLIILFFICIGSIYTKFTTAQSNESLLMYRTNFSDTRFFYKFNQSIVNTTRQLLTLNGTEAIKNLEDFNDWTKVGTDTTLINATKIEYDGNMRYLSNNWFGLVKEMGQDFNIEFKLNVDTIASSTSTLRGSILRYGDIEEDYRYHLDKNHEALTLSMKSQSSTTLYNLIILACENSQNEGSSDTVDLSVDTDYWVRFTRSEYVFDLYVFSDKDFSVLVDHISFDASIVWTSSYNFDKLAVLSNYGYGSSLSSTVYMSDLWLGESGGYEPVGWAYTEELLKNGTLPAFSLFFNRTLPVDTLINVYYSEDNETFNLLYKMVPDGIYDYIDLEHMNITKLYLIIELKTNNTLISPAINEMYVLRKSTAAGGGITGMVFGDLTWIVLGMWGFCLGIGFAYKDKEVFIVGTIVGIVLGLLVLSESQIIGFLIIIMNAYLLIRRVRR